MPHTDFDLENMNQSKAQPLQPRAATQHKQLQLSSTQSNLTVPTPPNTTESQDYLLREENSPESLVHSCDLPENQARTSIIRASSPILRSSVPVTARPSTESEYSDDSDVEFVEDPENDTRNTPENAPWKYVGYPLFSRWLARDNALLIVRRFGTLNSRIALSMQDDIVVLEKELDGIERILSDKKYDWRINNGSFRNDPLGPQGRRHKIIKEELPKKLAEYNAFINGYTQLISRPDIHKDDLSAVQKWFRVNNGAIDDEEAQYILANCDLIGVQPKPRSCLRQVLEMTVLRIPIFRSCFTRRPCPIYLEGNEKGFKGKTILQDDRKVEKASSFIVAVVGIGMLLGPLWILAYVTSTTNRLGVITAFVAIFFILVKVATKARIFDSLAATAAYSAVLMVFLQAPGI